MLNKPTTTQEIPVMRIKVDSTTYIVNLHFKATGGEKLNDKLHRLLRYEVQKNAASGQ